MEYFISSNERRPAIPRMDPAMETGSKPPFLLLTNKSMRAASEDARIDAESINGLATDHRLPQQNKDFRFSAESLQSATHSCSTIAGTRQAGRHGNSHRPIHQGLKEVRHDASSAKERYNHEDKASTKLTRANKLVVQGH